MDNFQTIVDFEVKWFLIMLIEVQYVMPFEQALFEQLYPWKR
jgi:hypothetical protein